MLIQGALLHAGGRTNSRELLAFLAGSFPAGRYFHVDPPPGIIMAAAIEWRVVLHEAAALQQFFAFLWNFYESRFPLSRETGSSDAPGIFIQVKNEHGAFDQFALGRDIVTREELVGRLEGSLKTLFPKNGSGAPELEIEDTLDSGFWTEIGHTINH
jgi:hypothetical protein